MSSFRVYQAVRTTRLIQGEPHSLVTGEECEILAKSAMGRGVYRYQIGSLGRAVRLWVDADAIEASQFR